MIIIHAVTLPQVWLSRYAPFGEPPFYFGSIARQLDCGIVAALRDTPLENPQRMSPRHAPRDSPRPCATAVGVCVLWDGFALLLVAAVAAQAVEEAAPLELLTNAQQVLALGVEGARQAPHLVRLRAVVTFPVIRRPWFYVQDATGGILVVCTNLPREPVAGELVEVVGTAGPGLQAPHIFSADYRVLGTAPLPEPRRTDPARLIIGKRSDSGFRWKATWSISSFTRSKFPLLLQEGEQHFVVNIRLTEPLEMPAHWMGARVEAQGVCWTEARADGVPTAFAHSHAGGPTPSRCCALVRPICSRGPCAR